MVFRGIKAGTVKLSRIRNSDRLIMIHGRQGKYESVIARAYLYRRGRISLKRSISHIFQRRPGHAVTDDNIVVHTGRCNRNGKDSFFIIHIHIAVF